jgi:error-prone DNA polymerase
LFAAAAEREMKTFSEQHEPEVRLRQMTEGHNVVEDYGHVGLTLREHPVAFLRQPSEAEHRHLGRLSAAQMAAGKQAFFTTCGRVNSRQCCGGSLIRFQRNIFIVGN